MIEFVITSDGSKTLYQAEVGEHYHSRHGAVQESRHVFLNTGLRHSLSLRQADRVSVLEVGFGTGLNFLLSANYCLNEGIALEYTGIEAFPLPHAVICQTDYEQYVSPSVWRAFLRTYTDSLQTVQLIDTHCQVRILPQKVRDVEASQEYDVLYFDAFAAIHQPDMWTEETLSHVCGFLKPGGVFVTYAITGQLKRSMKNLGFEVEKMPGAPGKREMLRATKAP